MRLAYAADSVAGRAGAGAGAAQGRALGRGVAGAVPAARSRVASLILQEEMTQVAEAYSLRLGQSNVALTGNLTTWKMEKTETSKIA